jgi:hypothetical protein
LAGGSPHWTRLNRKRPPTLFAVPPRNTWPGAYLARNAQELLLPREVVERDAPR